MSARIPRVYVYTDRYIWRIEFGHSYNGIWLGFGRDISDSREEELHWKKKEYLT